MSWSQVVDNHRADIHLFKKYINQKRNDGIFLELGGFDGITYSNTYALEKFFKFKGMLIEPSPINFKKMINNRPKCINIHCAISNTLKEIEFVGDGTAVGGPKNILDTMINNGAKWEDAWKLKQKKVKVQAYRLDNLLHKHNIKYIDFWSLDVEGSELEVLKTMDWKIPVYIIVMEVKSWISKETVDECRKILLKNGFTSEGIFGIDEWWINKNYFRKGLLFK